MDLLKMWQEVQRLRAALCLSSKKSQYKGWLYWKKLMKAVNVKHSSASDPKINTIRFIEIALWETQRPKAALSKGPKNFSTMDKFIENALQETQRPKAALCLKIQRILVPQINLLKDLQQWWMSSTTVPRIPKSIPSGIDLLKMHYEKHEGQRQRCI